LSSVARRRNNAQCSTSSFSPRVADGDGDFDNDDGDFDNDDGDFDNNDGDFDNDDGDFDNDDGDFDNDDGDFDNNDGDGPGHFDHPGATANSDSSHASPTATFCRWLSCRK